MRYSELVSELEYWKSVSGEDDPEIVVRSIDFEQVLEIGYVSASPGIEEETAIGINFYE